jgi:hypothetical protein
MLFVGLTPVAVVQAKRRRQDVAGSIEQAKRYSRGYSVWHQQEPREGIHKEFFRVQGAGCLMFFLKFVQG